MNNIQVKKWYRVKRKCRCVSHNKSLFCVPLANMNVALDNISSL